MPPQLCDILLSATTTLRTHLPLHYTRPHYRWRLGLILNSTVHNARRRAVSSPPQRALGVLYPLFPPPRSTATVPSPPTRLPLSPHLWTNATYSYEQFTISHFLPVPRQVGTRAAWKTRCSGGMDIPPFHCHLRSSACIRNHTVCMLR